MNATAMARAAQALGAAAREHRDTLDLQGLGLESLPPWPAGLVALRRLELGGNRLQALPPELWQATALEHLGLAGNQLLRLDPGIGRLQRLQTLDLSGNLLSTLPDELGQCTSLTHLHLGANQLQALPAGLARLTGLRVLDLNANRLSTVTLLASLTGLEELLLDDNPLTEIPATVRLLPRLRVFSASANPLEKKPVSGPSLRWRDDGLKTKRGFGFIELPAETKAPEHPFATGSEPPEDPATPAPAAARRMRRSPGKARASARGHGSDAPAWSALPSPPRPKTPAEPVDAAVFCPPRVARESVFLVQVFVYPPGAESQVEQRAQQADAAAERRGTWSLPLDVPRGTRIDLRLEMPGLVVTEPDAALVWRGSATAAQFEVEVPSGAAGANVVGRVRFAIDGMPAGTLRFQVVLLAAGSGSAAVEPQAVQAQRYRRAFVSYSSKDRAEVLRRVQAFKIAGLSVFQDILDLDPGERWERALYREIDGCDVFLLFWSHAAADSPWVAREIEYALARKAGDDDRPPAIQPVPIEGPPIVPPPPALGGLHFNDALLAQIAMAEAARPSKPSTASP